MTTPLRLNLEVAIDTKQAKQGLGDIRADVTALGRDAQASTGGVASLSQQIDKMADSQRKALVPPARPFAEQIAPPVTSSPATAPRGGTDVVKLREGYFAAEAAARVYRNELEKLDQAQTLGAVSAVEATAIRGRLSAAYERETANLARVQKGTGLASHEMGNLSFQINDMATMLAMGASPFQILASQGGQVYQILAGSAGGVTGALKGLGVQLLGVASAIGPVGLGFAGLAAGAGAYALLTREKVEPIGDMLTEHKAAVDALASGYDGLADAIRNVGSASPAVAGFNERYSREMLTFSARSSFMQGADDLGGLLGPQVFLGTEGGNGRNRERVGLPYEPFSDALLTFRRQLKDGTGDALAFQDAVAQIANQDPTNEALQKTAASLLEISNDAAKAQRQIEALDKAFVDLRRSRLSEGMGTLRDFVPDRRPERDVIDAEAERLSGLAESYGQLMEIERLRLAAHAELDQAESRRRAGFELELQAVTARTSAERALIAAQRVRLELAGELTDAAEIERQALETSNLVFAQTVEEAAQAVRTAQSAYDLAGLQGYEQQLASINQRIAEQIELADGSADAIAAWRRVQRLEIDALNTATTGALFDPQADKLRSLELETTLLGATDDRRKAALATLEAENALRRQGIDLASEWGRSYVENARQLSTFEDELRRQGEAFGSFRAAGESAIDGIFDGIVQGGESIADVFDGIARDILKSFTQLAVSNPLKNALLGTSYATMDDIGGLGGVMGLLRGEAPSGRPAPSLSMPALGLGSTPLTPMYVSLVDGLGGAGGPMGAIEQLLGGSAGGSSSALDAAAKAIRTIESGSAEGNYSAMGPLTRRGDRAHGAYQIMGENIGPWSQAALGRWIGSAEFLANPGLQDQIFAHRFGGYMQKYGAEGASRAWFAGEGGMNRLGSKDVLGTDVGRYGSRFSDLFARHGGGSTDFTRSMEETGASLATAGQSIAGSTAFFASGLDLNSKIMIDGMEGTVSEFLPKFGGNLTRLLSSLAGGEGGDGGFFGGIVKALSSRTGISEKAQAHILANPTGGLWSLGGYTGEGGIHEPAGLVHRGEVVWSQQDVRRAGGVQIVEALRLGRAGYANGGIVGGGSPAALAPQVVVNDYRTTRDAEPVATRTSDDGRSIEIMVRDRARDEMTTSGRAGNSMLEDAYGLRPQMIRR